MNKTERIVKILNVLKKQQANTMLGDMSGKYGAFQILISTILSARSRDEVTYPISKELFKKYPTASKLAKAKISEIRKIIKQIGFFNQKAKYIIETAKMIEKDGIPHDLEGLMKFPGVGRKVAGCVVVYAFGGDAIPVDVHVFRISDRIGLVKRKTPHHTELELMRITPKKYWKLVNDLFVWHGKTVCKPITPECDRCKIVEYCLFKEKNIKEKQKYQPPQWT